MRFIILLALFLLIASSGMAEDCDVCGRPISTTLSTGEHITCDGVYISFTKGDATDEQMEFYQSTATPYKIDRTYHICWACWLKALGIKVPERKRCEN